MCLVPPPAPTGRRGAPILILGATEGALDRASRDNDLTASAQAALMRIAAAIADKGAMTLAETSRHIGLHYIGVNKNVRLLAARGYLRARQGGVDLGGSNAS